jgi:hypothetical protein
LPSRSSAGWPASLRWAPAPPRCRRPSAPSGSACRIPRRRSAPARWPAPRAWADSGRATSRPAPAGDGQQQDRAGGDQQVADRQQRVAQDRHGRLHARHPRRAGAGRRPHAARRAHARTTPARRPRPPWCPASSCPASCRWRRCQREQGVAVGQRVHRVDGARQAVVAHGRQPPACTLVSTASVAITPMVVLLPASMGLGVLAAQQRAARVEQVRPSSCGRRRSPRRCPDRPRRRARCRR